MSDLDSLKGALLADIEAAGDEAALEAVRVAAMGKKGSVSETPEDAGRHEPGRAPDPRCRHQRAEE